MDIATMMAIGLFDDDDQTTKGKKTMTDVQFKTFIKMCRVLANSTNEAKQFIKWMKASGSMDVQSTHGALVFAGLLVQIAEATGSVDSVRQALQETLADLSNVG
ncbi:MAG: hypothetical protein FWC71_06600 [Defluviitaleaceae bacterium]|nr:hypothetical protein [Defluviitaleaceae bacterium]